MFSPVQILSILAVSSAVIGQSPVGPGPTANYQAAPGTQVGTINQNIRCNVTVGGLLAIRDANFTLRVGGALTTTALSGTGFNIVGSAIATSSVQFTQDLRTLGFSSFAGQVVTFTVNAVGSTSGSVNGAATPITIPNTTVPAVGTPVVLNLPTSGSITIGPITPASGVSTVVLSVGGATINLNATRNGRVVPSVVTCPAVTQRQDLAFVSVGTGASTVVTPSGFFPPITSTPAQSLLGSSGLNYACTVQGVTGTQTYATDLTTFAPQLSVPRGTSFQVQNSYGLITITQAQVNAILSTLTAAQQSATKRFQVTVTSLVASATGLSSSTINIISSAVNSQIITIGTGPYTAIIPGSGTLPPITLTAGTTAGTALTFVGNAAVTITALDTNNAVVTSRTATCAAPTTPRAPLFPVEIS